MTGIRPVVVYNSISWSELLAQIHHIDAAIISPGPGRHCSPSSHPYSPLAIQGKVPSTVKYPLLYNLLRTCMGSLLLGHPASESDLGVSRRLLLDPVTSQLPILGVCMGLQGMVVAYGGQVIPSPNGQYTGLVGTRV